MTLSACALAQMQFYVTFPFVLMALRPSLEGFRKRLALLLAAVIVLSVPQHIYVAQ